MSSSLFQDITTPAPPQILAEIDGNHVLMADPEGTEFRFGAASA
jgi:hypothetical protein